MITSQERYPTLSSLYHSTTTCKFHIFSFIRNFRSWLHRTSKTNRRNCERTCNYGTFIVQFRHWSLYQKQPTVENTGYKPIEYKYDSEGNKIYGEDFESSSDDDGTTLNWLFKDSMLRQTLKNPDLSKRRRRIRRRTIWLQILGH